MAGWGLGTAAQHGPNGSRAHHGRQEHLTIITVVTDISSVELVRHQLVHRVALFSLATRSSCKASHGRQTSSAVVGTWPSCPVGEREDELDRGW